MTSMVHKAKKIVIITEKVITEGVAKIIEECGATGYTITAAGGKGSRGIRGQERNTLFDSFVNVKIEVIISDPAKAKEIIDKVALKYFENYSGITYQEDVEILRPQKF